MWTEYRQGLPLPWGNMDSVLSPFRAAGKARIDECESMVRKLLDTQIELSDSVTQRMGSSSYLPSGSARLLKQAHDVQGQIINVQEKAWATWFSWLRSVAGAEAAVTARVVATDLEKPADLEPTPQAAAEPAALPVEPVAEPASTYDDLTAINGVGPAVVRKLHQAGVTSFRQIAEWSDEDISRLADEILGNQLAGRVRRGDWVGQARELMA